MTNDYLHTYAGGGEDAKRANHPGQIETRRLRPLQGQLISGGGHFGVACQPTASEADKQVEPLQPHRWAGKGEGMPPDGR